MKNNKKCQKNISKHKVAFFAFFSILCIEKNFVPNLV